MQKKPSFLDGLKIPSKLKQQFLVLGAGKRTNHVQIFPQTQRNAFSFQCKENLFP
jgi:hypothetical protein